MAERVARFGWNFQALETFLELTGLHLKSPDFLEELEALYVNAPEPVKDMKFDMVWGAKDGRIGVAELFVPLEGATLAVPANITGIEDRYDSSWQAVIELIGSDHPWLGKVEDVVKRWGLLAVWGPGVVVETMVDQDGRKRRSEGEDSVQMPYFEMTWNIRRIPVVDDMFPISPPAAYPGMTDEQWNQDVEEFRKEGLSRLRAYRTNLPKFEVWSARYSEMEQHVEWLFRRITPPYLTPVNQAYEGLSIHTIEIGIRKTARLLGLRVSPGVRGPRKLRGLERQERKGREVPS